MTITKNTFMGHFIKMQICNCKLLIVFQPSNHFHKVTEQTIAELSYFDLILVATSPDKEHLRAISLQLSPSLVSANDVAKESLVLLKLNNQLITKTSFLMRNFYCCITLATNVMLGCDLTNQIHRGWTFFYKPCSTYV